MPDNDIAALVQAALEHHQAGRLPAAEALYRQALARHPEIADALHGLGLIALQVGQPAAALELIGRAAQLAPERAEIQSNLGEAHRLAGRLAEAMACYERALALAPGHAQAHNNRGIVYSETGRCVEAEACFQRALALAPDYADALNNLSSLCRRLGRVDEAIAGFSRAQALRPNHASIPSNLAAAFWDAGRVDEALASYRRALELDPGSAAVHSALVYSCLFHPAFDARELLRLHREWAARHADPLRATLRPQARDRSPDRRLRIGYVSPDFRDHVVGRNVLPLLRQHDRSNFEIHCYAEVLKSDAFTEEFRARADVFREITKLPADHVAELIRADAIDILVDLSLHLADNRLPVFARKPAPVQVTFAGYPGTTGLSTIDYRLTDPYLDPPGVDADYSEKSVRLPHTFWCYAPGGDEPEVNPLPAASRGHVTFGCLNNPGKISADTLALWARVLREVRASRLQFLAAEGSARERLIRGLGAAGVEADRLEFMPRLARRDYLEQYRHIDLGLDSLPYNGHTTSLDSCWMGVPVVTLVGNTVAGRAGFSQLSNLGLTELAARSPEEFVRIAARLAGDLDRLAALRATLRERMARSPLMNAAQFTHDIETAYRAMWRAWCAQPA